MYKNTDFIYDAIVQLQQVADIEAEVDSSRNEYDAIVTISGIQFIVIAKSEIRTSNKGVVYSDIESLKQRTGKPIIVIAKFIANDIAMELKEKGVNYIDKAGNSCIKQGSLLIFITGKRPEKPTNVNQSRAFQESGLKLIYHLLQNPESLQLTYRNLAKLAGVSIGSVSNVITELENQRFILKTRTKRVLKNKVELLQRWVIAYNDVLRPRLLKKKMKFSKIESYGNWDTLPIHEANGVNLWGGEPGAALLSGQLQPELFTIYTNTNWHEVASELKLIPDEDGEIEILTMFWGEEEKYREYYNTPSLIIYADLMGSGYERNIQIANEILENELQHIK